MLLPCGFLPAAVGNAEEVNEVLGSQVQVPETTEEVSGADVSSFVEDNINVESHCLIPGVPEQSVSQFEKSLNPEAPEFISEQADLAESNAEVDSFPPQGRPQRRRVPPSYLSDYHVGGRAFCTLQSVDPRTQQEILHCLFLSLQQQLAWVVHAMASSSDGDVTV